MRTQTLDLSRRSYPLCGLLFCICGQPFSPCATGDSRSYMSRCGCRLKPIDACTVERSVHAAATRSAPGVDTLTPERLAQLFTRIEIGGTAEDVRLFRRP